MFLEIVRLKMTHLITFNKYANTTKSNHKMNKMNLLLELSLEPSENAPPPWHPGQSDLQSEIVHCPESVAAFTDYTILRFI